MHHRCRKRSFWTQPKMTKRQCKSGAILCPWQSYSFLFTRMAACDDNFVPGASSFLVSTDGGRSWQKRGPRLEGYEFRFGVCEGWKGLDCGRTHRGRACNRTGLFSFQRNRSFTGRCGRFTRALAAWNAFAWGSIGRADRVGPASQARRYWKGPTYIHQSLDEGRTWKTLGRARKLKMEKGIEFHWLGKLKDPLWRIINSHYETDYRVQHREARKCSLENGYKFCTSRLPLNASRLVLVHLALPLICVHRQLSAVSVFSVLLFSVSPRGGRFPTRNRLNVLADCSKECGRHPPIKPALLFAAGTAGKLGCFLNATSLLMVPYEEVFSSLSSRLSLFVFLRTQRPCQQPAAVAK